MLVTVVFGRDPRIGIQEDNNGFAVLLDPSGDLTKVGLPKILAGPEFAVPLKQILVYVNLNFEGFREPLNMIDIAEVADDFDWQRFC